MGLLPPSYSLFSSIALSVVTFASMQMFKDVIAVEGNLLRLSLGGFCGSWLFIFILTAIGNFYSLLFPRNSHVSLFPEVIAALFVSVLASAFVHRICASTCLIFSLIALYYLNKMASPSSTNASTIGSSAGNEKKKTNVQSKAPPTKSPPTPKSSRKDKR